MYPFKMKLNSLLLTVIATIMILFDWSPKTVLALTGREIMDRVNERETGDRSTSEMEMILIDKKGRKRVRNIQSFGMEKGDDSLSLMFFLSPADVKNTGFLTFDYDASGKDDDQWLYLPALRKTKRIASGDKSGSFMGSDFNYSDMTSPDLDEYDYTLMKETEVRGKPVWQIKAVPKSKAEIEESGYTQSVLFVRQDNYVVVRVVHWVHKKKRLKYMDVKKLEQIEGVWVATEMQMTTKSGKKTLHRTVIRTKNTRFNQDSVNEELFSIRRLEKGA